MSPRGLAAAAILLIWLSSILLPVADTTNPTGPDIATGLTILALGWAGPLIGQFGWFANLLLPLALLACAKWPERTTKFSLVSALILATLAINTTFWSSIPMDNGENVIVRYRWGYWLWLASVISGSLWLLIHTLSRRPNLMETSEPLRRNPPHR